MSTIQPVLCTCDTCGTEHQIEGQWRITNTYRYRIHYKAEHAIGPATELKEVEAETLKSAKDYAKQRAVELDGSVVEVYKLEASA